MRQSVTKAMKIHPNKHNMLVFPHSKIILDYIFIYSLRPIKIRRLWPLKLENVLQYSIKVNKTSERTACSSYLCFKAFLIMKTSFTESCFVKTSCLTLSRLSLVYCTSFRTLLRKWVLGAILKKTQHVFTLDVNKL